MYHLCVHTLKYMHTHTHMQSGTPLAHLAPVVRTLGWILSRGGVALSPSLIQVLTLTPEKNASIPSCMRESEQLPKERIPQTVGVLVSQGSAVTKYHTLGGLTTEVYALRSSGLDV